MSTHYEILGVPVTAAADEIKRAWRQIARESHPDLRGGDASAVARFKRASEAYEVLSDSGRRETYDFGLRVVARFEQDSRRARPPWESRRAWAAPRPHPEAGRGHRYYRSEAAMPAAHDLRPDAQRRHDEAVSVLAPAVALISLGPFAMMIGAGMPTFGLVAVFAVLVMWWKLERGDPYRLPMVGLALIVAAGAAIGAAGY